MAFKTVHIHIHMYAMCTRIMHISIITYIYSRVTEEENKIKFVFFFNSRVTLLNYPSGIDLLRKSCVKDLCFGPDLSRRDNGVWLHKSSDTSQASGYFIENTQSSPSTAVAHTTTKIAVNNQLFCAATRTITR